MKKRTPHLFTGIGLICIAIAIYYKPNDSNPERCISPCIIDCCETKRDLTLSQQEGEIKQMLDRFTFDFNVNDTLQNQVYFISQKRNKNFVVFAKILGSTNDGKIKSLRFTLLNSEDSYYKIAHITQPTLIGSPDKNGNNKILIDLFYEESDCDLPYIPKWYDLNIEEVEHYIKKGDVVVHSESPSQRPEFIHRLYETKSFEVGEHICRVKFY